ncbi:hypothetical protein [Bacillus taeanensis]|uniref:DUF4025 domain-containing protein n=1 Tax=Bacillus taeanensis TaxID=273032 RepID=A0A366XZF8_9BACI|nr:hypothetical protein [Bacillus taeanensis]RBW69533.1 hypothetical protein DS031_11475 [Bacillus taeanensis]
MSNHEHSENLTTAEANIKLNQQLDGIGKDSVQHNLSESEAESANNKINEYFTQDDEEKRTTPTYLTHNTAAVRINKEE